MTALTPEAARAAAEWLTDRIATDRRSAALASIAEREGLADYFTYWAEVEQGELDALTERAEADRLEAAAKTPGQVLAEASSTCGWDAFYESDKALFERRAAAVIAHHVGPDRVVVDRDDLVETLRWTVGASLAGDISKASTRLREALS